MLVFEVNGQPMQQQVLQQIEQREIQLWTQYIRHLKQYEASLEVSKMMGSAPTHPHHEDGAPAAASTRVMIALHCVCCCYMRNCLRLSPVAACVTAWCYLLSLHV